MEKKLQQKFIITSILAVIIVLFLISFAINISNFHQINVRTNKIIDILVTNDGKFPKQNTPKDVQFKKDFNEETPFQTRFFSVALNNDNEAISVDTGKIAAINTDDAIDFATQIANNTKKSGFFHNYKYKVIEKDYGLLIMFVDVARDLEVFHNFVINTVLICVVGTILVFILLIFLSKKVVSPIAKSYQKQKTFITDASHELKTPLAIISANNDILELDYGDNEWCNSTKVQIKKLNELIINMISLSKMEEETAIKTDFSISDAVFETIEHYKNLYTLENKKLTLYIQKNVSFYGDEGGFRTVVAILLDNALKYSNKNVILTFNKNGKKIILQTENDSDNLEKRDYNDIFERFTRVENSRNTQTGGFGIGLSIVKAFVDKHKGKTFAKSDDGENIVIGFIL